MLMTVQIIRSSIQLRGDLQKAQRNDAVTHCKLQTENDLRSAKDIVLLFNARRTHGTAQKYL